MFDLGDLIRRGMGCAGWQASTLIRYFVKS